jgi:hypothetical protein
MTVDQGVNFGRYRKSTRRDEFQAAIDAIVPWTMWCEVIEPQAIPAAYWVSGLMPAKPQAEVP